MQLILIEFSLCFQNPAQELLNVLLNSIDDDEALTRACNEAFAALPGTSADFLLKPADTKSTVCDDSIILS